MQHVVKMTQDPRPVPTAARDMEVGEIGIIRSSFYAGLHIVKTYDGFVALEKPSSTWGVRCTLQVDVLPAGTELTISVGAGS